MGLELTRSDIVAIHDLVEACCELWWDPAAWQDRLVEGLNTMIGAELCAFTSVRGRGETLVFKEGRHTHGDDAGVRKVFADMLRDGARLFPADPLVTQQVVTQGYCTATFAELSTAASDKPKAAEFLERFLRPVGVVHCLHAGVSVSPDYLVQLVACRPRGGRAFSTRERDVATALSAAIAARCDKKLGMAHQRERNALTPRERDVLEALLEGDAEKQIAARLGLSVATAHEYVTSLYRSFDVHSRGELMAYFLRRGPPEQPERERLTAPVGRTRHA